MSPFAQKKLRTRATVPSPTKLVRKRQTSTPACLNRSWQLLHGSCNPPSLRSSISRISSTALIFSDKPPTFLPLNAVLLGLFLVWDRVNGDTILLSQHHEAKGLPAHSAIPSLLDFRCQHSSGQASKQNGGLKEHSGACRPEYMCCNLRKRPIKRIPPLLIQGATGIGFDIQVP